MQAFVTENDKTEIKKFLEENKYYDILPLGKGGYADVLSAKSPNHEETAIKIIKKIVSWEVEEQIWPLLNHQNILPVLNVFHLPQNELQLYVCPRHPTSLDRMVHCQEFRNDIQGLNRIRKWLRQTLNGLAFLHNIGFCHMDLKSDNILISATDSAIICDFSGLAISELKTKRYELLLLISFIVTDRMRF